MVSKSNKMRTVKGNFERGGWGFVSTVINLHASASVCIINFEFSPQTLHFDKGGLCTCSSSRRSSIVVEVETNRNSNAFLFPY